MAVELIEQTKCDECGKEGMESFTISQSGSTVVVDLCNLHAGRLRSLMEKGSTGPRRRAGGTRKGGGFGGNHAVVTVD